ncbi:MAG: stage II sporulation protein P [Clostridiales bacterium]|nr:stage II sporulation protein P [Clostridiales bacterium]
MYSLRETIPKKQKKKRINTKSGFDIGYIILLLGILIFLIRFIGIVNKYEQLSRFVHINLLNYSMPVVKTQIYDENNFNDDDISFKNAVLESVGLKGISAYRIIGKELGIFYTGLQNLLTDLPIANIKPFSLKKESIATISEEELAELNKVSPAYDESLKKPLDNSKPEVLIFHTHAIENYAEVGELTTDSNFNVVGVGEVLAKELEEGYGISVIHDKTNHSVSYNDSYKRSNETLNSYLQEYGDFKLIIDLHRDSVTNKDAVTVNLNDQNLAKLMFVLAENSQRYAANQELANNLLNISNSLFPGLMKNNYIYPVGATAVNHSLSDNFVLIEVGANINEAQEAKLSAKYIARIVAEYINGE